MKNLHKAKVYAKIKQLRQRIYGRNTGWPARHIQEEDLEFVDSQLEKMDNDEIKKIILRNEKKMEISAKKLDFFEAARLRDEIIELKKIVDKKLNSR